MSYIAVIVESPAKCCKIEKILGTGYKCMASYGHFREVNTLKHIDFNNNFKINYTLSKNKLDNVKKLKTFISKSTSVIIASDDDREGEAIGWHICDYFNLSIKTTKRIKFNEITETAIKKSVLNYGYLDMNLVYSQQARQCLDLLVGFTITPLLWKHISYNSKNSLSAGRCQTPALQIIYDNQKEIDKSPGKLVYNTSGYFTNKNLLFKLNKHFGSSLEVNNFLETSINFNHVFKKENVKTIEKQPPNPLSTSCLQQLSSNILHYSPKLTMTICQTLYESGLITYMRTDSKIYSMEFINTTSKYIITKYGVKYVSSDLNKLVQGKNEKKSDIKTQDAHEAIRPTDINLNELKMTSKITQKECRMYKLIYETTLESCMANAVFNSLSCQITAPTNYLYKNISESNIFPGWKIVKGFDNNTAAYNYNLNMKDNCDIKYNKIYSEFSMIELKSHYTEAKLVKKLEKLGIGRPSTFSSLVEKIQTRNYVKKQNIEGNSITSQDFELIDDCLSEIEITKTFGNEKNKLVIDPIGIIVIEFLNKYFNDLFNYDYTKIMENKLDLIANNNMTSNELCLENYNLIESLIKTNKLNSLNHKKEGEFQIDEIHSYIIGKFGPVIKCNQNNKITFKKVKDNLDIDKLKNNELLLDDIIDTENTSINNNIIGKYKDFDIIIKNGKYGYYILYNSKNISIDKKKYDIDNLSYETAIEIIDNYYNNQNKSIIRIINDEFSIRKGKFGDYIYYKTVKMKKPKFINLNNFKHDYTTCDENLIFDFI